MKTFDFYCSMPIQEVMADQTKFIIPENIAAINYLWDMNILTTQNNDYDNSYSWIALGYLSRENEKIFREMQNDPQYADPNKPGILEEYGGGLRIPVKPGTADTLEYFMPLFMKFKMQDVQRDGYLTLDEFFGRYTDCYRTIKNPYFDMEPNPDDYTNLRAYLEAAKEFDRMRYPNSPRIRVFEPSLMTKSIEEYIEEAGFAGCYDADEGKVFLNRRLYEGHMRYKQGQGLETSKPHSR